MHNRAQAPIRRPALTEPAAAPATPIGRRPVLTYLNPLQLIRPRGDKFRLMIINAGYLDPGQAMKQCATGRSAEHAVEGKPCGKLGFHGISDFQHFKLESQVFTGKRVVGVESDLSVGNGGNSEGESPPVG